MVGAACPDLGELFESRECTRAEVLGGLTSCDMTRSSVLVSVLGLFVLSYMESEFNAVTKILLVENTADVAFNSSQA